MSKSISVLCCLLLASSFLSGASASQKLTIYWGQNSNGAEKNLAHYCTDSIYDTIVIGFVIGFPTAPGDNLPWMNLADHCEDQYPGHPYLLSCPQVGADIQYCQQQGKKIFLSFGGAVGQYGFTSDAVAQTFASTVWNMFLGGSSSVRPFGDGVVFDGVDLDIEGYGTTGYAAFVKALRTNFVGASKPYYISAAPQCVYPDGYLGPDSSQYHSTAFQSAWFDFIWVQFYNNYCGLNAYPGAFNFNSWANWAANISVNKNVQVFIGAPAGPAAAGSGFVSANTLSSIASAMQAQYGSILGGVMLWDCANSESNNNFGQQVAKLIKSGNQTPPSPPPAPLTTGKAKPPAAPQTTGQAAPQTTGQAAPQTTGKVAPITSGQVAPVTSGKAAKTTGKAGKATTGAITSGIPGISTPSSSSSTTCNDGQMKCVTSETYQSCSHGAWQVVQSCQVGLTCTPVGSYIYCE